MFFDFGVSQASQNRETIEEIFFNSARTGDLDTLLNKYLKLGFDVSSRDTKGNSAIIIASGRGHNDVIKILLEYGANFEDYTSQGIFEGKSSLSWAAS